MQGKLKNDGIYSMFNRDDACKKVNTVICCLVAIAGFTIGTSFSAHAQSQSWTFTENNNNVIKTQRDGGVTASSGNVTIDFFGHMAFRIVSPRGTSIMIDPWRNDPSGYWGVWYPEEFPEVPVDIVLSTHAHFDHDAVYRPHATMVLERLAGEFTLGDVKITGLADKHMCDSQGWYKWTKVAPEFGQDFCPPDNFMHMDNFIQIVETGGLRIAHWGDNRPVPADHVMDALIGVDVLFITVDGSSHILDYGDIAEVIAKVKPKIVIPGHYYTKGSSSVLTTLSDADEWVSQKPGAVTLKSSRLVLNPDEVKKMSGTTVYYFGANFTTE